VRPPPRPRRTPQWVDHVQNLYRENMARTRKGVSLTFAPKKPFYQQNPLDYVPILLPKEQQTVWHWVAFVLGCVSRLPNLDARDAGVRLAPMPRRRGTGPGRGSARF